MSQQTHRKYRIASILLLSPQIDSILPSTGEKGLLAMAPPHQGIDGEWSDRSGVIVYKWNEKSNRPKHRQYQLEKEMELLCRVR